MAVYRFVGGQFERLAAAMDELDGTFRGWDGTFRQFAESKGMWLLDDVAGVYELFGHAASGVRFTRLKEYRWWFHLVDELDAADEVLIPDSLPDYLAFMAMLRPLVERAAELKRETAGGAQ